MFGKLVYGQFSLKETFWKFGVVVIYLLSIVTKTFGSILNKKIQGLPIKYYYTHYFYPVNFDSEVLTFTIIYFVLFSALSLYSIMVLFGVWRSSREYDKSIWLRHIARLFILLVIYSGIKFAII